MAADEADEPDEQEGEDANLEVDADGWSDLMEGKIRKRTLTEGSGPHPEMNQDVICSFEVRKDGDAAEKVLQHHHQVRFRIGEGEAIPMLELSLRHMAEGSVCEVVGTSTWAWGPAGLPAAAEGEQEVPPGTDVRLVVTLHRCVPAADGRDPSWSEKVEIVTWRKSNGNDHFRRREFVKAKRCYNQACEVFGGDYEAPEEVADRASASASARGLVADCAANLAAVHLKLGDAPQAKEAAEGALMMAPGNVKSLYRLGRACLLLDEFQECREAIEKALEADPENKDVRQLQSELRSKRQQYSAKSKRLAGAVVGSLGGEYEGAAAPAAASASSSSAAPAAEPTSEACEASGASEAGARPAARGLQDTVREAITEYRSWIVGAVLLALVIALLFLALPLPQAREATSTVFLVTGSAISVMVIRRGDEEIKNRQL